METKMIRKVLFVLCLTGLLPILANAQFNSGSTGADGALDLSNCPTSFCEVQLPESGVLNYTTVLVPANKGLTFKMNSRNTPVLMLAQGNVVILGQISVAAPYQNPSNIPGNGGFYGGNPLQNGFGPGGGTSGSPSGKWVGPLSLNPIIGGSGGYGPNPSNSGGGGGGAILIASSNSVTISSGAAFGLNLNARGTFYATLGSGGSVRIVANSINVSGSIDACNPHGGGASVCGVVRLEALQGQLNFTGSSNPPATLVPFVSGSIPVVTTTSLPQLTIQSIAGYNVPAYAGSRFDTVDLLLPNQIPDPVNVVVQAVNIPSGTQVQVGFVSGSPNGTSTTCILSGGPGPLSCVATVSNLNRTGVTYLLATATFTPPSSLAQFNPKGENYVDKVKLEAVLGTKPKYIFLSSQGKIIDNTKISKSFLEFFGM
jgi:hypothetical protein